MVTAGGEAKEPDAGEIIGLATPPPAVKVYVAEATPLSVSPDFVPMA